MESLYAEKGKKEVRIDVAINHLISRVGEIF